MEFFCVILAATKRSGGEIGGDKKDGDEKDGDEKDGDEKDWGRKGWGRTVGDEKRWNNTLKLQ